MPTLRTFLSSSNMKEWSKFGEPGHQLTSKVLHDMVPKLRFLRVLSLARFNIVELPNSVCSLKYLRYLNLSHTQIKRLPESAAEFFNLQTLFLQWCCELTKLPVGIGNLTNLHCLDISHCNTLKELPLGIGNLINLHSLDIRGCSNLKKLPLGINNLTNLQCLDISDTSHLQEMPPHIGNLRNLHKLTKFIVRKDNGMKLTELKKLSKLQGKLRITELQNMVDIQDAEFAILKDKHGMEEIEYHWAHPFHGSRNPNDEVKVLNSLRPHQNLSSLSIMNFGGNEFPLWIGVPIFSNMVTLELINCCNVTSLPPLGQLPSLTKLRISFMSRVKEVGVELYGHGACFASLDTLRIHCMDEWWQWLCSSNDMNEEAAVRFPKLHYLEISYCLKLVGKLPSCLPSLQELCFKRCQEALLRTMSGCTSLTTLKIYDISGLISLDDAHIEDMVALQHLEIEYCKEIKYLWKEETNLEKLASLKSLDISHCEQMVSLVDGDEGKLPCNLQVLRIEYCDNLEKLTNGLHRLTCLLDLNIEGCNKLESLTCLLVSCNLRKLKIRKCDSLKSFPEGIMSVGNQMSHFEDLIISSSRSLESSPNGQFPNDFRMEIVYCPQLELFPETGLPIQALTSLYIYNCMSLRSLSSQMQNLTSLRSLVICECGGLESFPEGGLSPNLTYFKLQNCKNLKQPMSEWALHRLTSLARFEIQGAVPSIDLFNSFPDNDGLPLPSSLTHLHISCLSNLKSISRGIRNLISLEHLHINSCATLQSLPEEGFSPSLKHLSIISCPDLHWLPEKGLPPTLVELKIFCCRVLEEWCLKRRRDHRSIISHIPVLEIDLKRYYKDTDSLAIYMASVYSKRRAN